MQLEHQRNENKTKYDSYTLPGNKKNYTELLLTLPPKKGTPPPLLDKLSRRLWRSAADPSKRETGGLYHVLPPGQIHARPFAGSHPTERQAHDAALKVLNSNRYYEWEAANERNKFTSSHFEEPNILAHVRFDERTDADGKPILFIEEVQSDWHRGKSLVMISAISPERIEIEKRLKELTDKYPNDGWVKEERSPSGRNARPDSNEPVARCRTARAPRSPTIQDATSTS